ncbi:transcriptional regulator [Subtercola boreus]|uniref:Transcriptional regulator n=1 Tax=Subtercola boreus TaxID=120213 RepID=A0A3E0VML7_9MICO|nr:helix-turn-helix domain-containing protein [Subtercola boreus]RFA10925.1 transcriptional regulator [Subtercola boreus]TQL55481.1 HxlR family transcriptional regulator [Subtercola boreus]
MSIVAEPASAAAVRAAILPVDPFQANCPSRVVLDHVTSKWGVLVIVALADQSQRWGELRRSIQGISEKMLAQTLRTLEADGLVVRTVQGTVPPRVDYELSPLGHDLAGRLLPLVAWVGEHAADIVAAPTPTPAPAV